MGPILHAIESIGAEQNSLHGKMPFEITGNPGLHAQWAEQEYRPTVVVDASLSSQYVSALMTEAGSFRPACIDSREHSVA